MRTSTLLGALSLVLAASAYAGPTIKTYSSLASAEKACVSAIAKRSAIVLEAGRSLAAMDGASAEQVVDMESSVREAHVALMEGVAAVAGSTLYAAPGDDGSGQAASALALVNMCSSLDEEASNPGKLEDAISRALDEKLFLAHADERSDLTEKMKLLEQYVLVKNPDTLKAHAALEPFLLKNMPTDELATKIKEIDDLILGEGKK